MEDLQGRKRQRYVCLTPTYIAWFHDEAAAEVSEEGFMCGDADHKALSSLASHGSRGGGVPTHPAAGRRPRPAARHAPL
jgi:hypothetical protein